MTELDCRTCGVCCVSLQDQEVYCDVTPADEKRMGPNLVKSSVLRPTPFDRLTAALDGRRVIGGAIKTKWAKQKTGPLEGYSLCVCVFLRGSVLKQVSCRIYDRRPDACRNALQPGQRQCLEARRLFREVVERDDAQRL